MFDVNNWDLNGESFLDSYEHDLEYGECDIDFLTIDSTTYHENIKQNQRRLSNKLTKTNKEPKPTKTTETYWLYVDNNSLDYPAPTDNSGKWLIFAPPKEIDAAWEQIKYGIKNGLLGSTAKVSTQRGWKGRGHDYVIVVYTYNWKDEEDVMQIRGFLRELGFEKPLAYKADEDTLKGKYRSKGHKNISKYYE